MIMKRFIKGTLFLLISVGVLSCSKPSPIDSQGEVAFIFEGTIDGNATVYEAGKNNYYLNTAFQDGGANDVLLMRGEFLDKANPTDNFLRFEFYGYDSSNNEGILNNVFDRINYRSYSTDSTLQIIGATTLKFEALYSTGAVITWDFGDGTTANGSSVTHTFPSNITAATVSMTAFYPAASCADSVDNFINLIDPVNSQVQFNVSALSLDSFQFIATTGFNNYAWDFGNSTTQQGAGLNNVSAYYTDSLRKTITLNATKTGVGTSAWKAVVTPKSNFCFAAYGYTVNSAPVSVVAIRPPYKSCVITYKTDGKEYSSYINDNSDQSLRNVFSLNTAKAYLDNPAGQKTIQLTGSVNTFLYNVNDKNDSIPIKGSRVSIAVAHP